MNIKKYFLFPIHKAKRLSEVIKDFFVFKSQNDGRFTVFWRNKNFQLNDAVKTQSGGGHYLYHPAWALRTILKNNPKKHIDISSILFFPAMLSAFLPVEYYDYGPANVILSNMISKSADLLKLPFKSNSVESLSCMHTIEHVGLGRYGDTVDPEGDIKAIRELKRVLKKGGDLLIVLPIGIPNIYFNAHRVYSYEQIVDYFSDLKLMEFSMLPDDSSKGLLKNPNPKIVKKQKYACGCFWFKK